MEVQCFLERRRRFAGPALGRHADAAGVHHADRRAAAVELHVCVAADDDACVDGGEEIAKPEPVPETPVVDLMEALKRSVEEAKGKKTAAKASGKKKAAPKSGSSGARRQPARKSA